MKQTAPAGAEARFGKLHVIRLGIPPVKGEYMEARFLSRSGGSARNSRNKRVKKAAPSPHPSATRRSHFFTRRLPERRVSPRQSKSTVSLSPALRR
ncbi:MAG TPA: hypothetical protein VKB61_01970 [Candidatus Acidoferrum sp.]|jgi:hypothetical protein|nr:hypothetical protein [Candidatus Acidoferrum sp.]